MASGVFSYVVFYVGTKISTYSNYNFIFTFFYMTLGFNYGKNVFDYMKPLNFRQFT